MRICFDLDKTLCEGSDYESCVPMSWASTLTRELKENGHTIIIYTARKMNSFNGNIGLVNKNIAELTLSQLREWNIIYDEIYFGKPSADIYIDDKGFKFSNKISLEKELEGFLK